MAACDELNTTPRRALGFFAALVNALQLKMLKFVKELVKN